MMDDQMSDVETMDSGMTIARNIHHGVYNTSNSQHNSHVRTAAQSYSGQLKKNYTLQFS
jgi:hypothetical protein